MVPRFYAPGLFPGASSVALDPDETHHLLHVLRLSEGDQARVFDGRGREWQGRVGARERRGAVIDALDPVTPLPEPRVGVTLIAGLLRGTAMDTLVRDATMLGVLLVVPVFTDHTSVSKRKDAVPVARWRKIAVTSCKQCGRAVVPDVVAPEPFSQALARPAGVRLLLTEPSADAPSRRRIDDLGPHAREGGVLIAIGPEGGWSPAELRNAEASGFVPWSLGTQVLRAETVPLAALSIARYAWEEDRR